MSNLDYIYIIFASIITVYIQELAYAKLTNKKGIIINYRNFLILIISGIFVTIITYFDQDISRIVLSFLILVSVNLLIFKDELKVTLYNMLICYILGIFYEIILSMVVLNTNIIDIKMFEVNIWQKSIFSFINVLLVYLTCYSKKIKIKVALMFNKYLNKNHIYYVLVVLLIVLIAVDFKYFVTLSKNIYFLNLLIILCVSVLIISNFHNYFKVIRESEKSEILLNFMSKYEKIVDEDRINRHEMLNNLLFLKSFDNKNSKEYDDALNELITIYNKKGIGIKNIYNLPTGLKGIFYYKLNGLEEKGYKLNIIISNKLSNSFKKLPHNEYVILYKIVGILLDNAVEAAEKSKDKYIGIDIYSEKSNIVIIIDNSFKGKIDLNKINNKDYTSKGKNRGLGLFIVNKLLKESELIHLEQIIELNVFTSKIIIKKDK